jgi:hypothetical protein
MGHPILFCDAQDETVIIVINKAASTKNLLFMSGGFNLFYGKLNE